MTLDNHKIVKLLEDMSQNAENMKRELLRFTWYMRGGLSYDEAMYLSEKERKYIRDIIKENEEASKAAKTLIY